MGSIILYPIGKYIVIMFSNESRSTLRYSWSMYEPSFRAGTLTKMSTI